MNRRAVASLLTLGILIVICAAARASAAPPTIAEIREAYDAGKYQPAIKMIGECLALKGDLAAAYDRYELLTLKGECLIRLKSPTYAADAFEDAQAAAGEDTGKRATAVATELLLRRTPQLKYIPRTGAGKTPIDVVAADSRKQAMKAMRDDMLVTLMPKLERALKANVLTPTMDLLPQLREAAVLEYGAAGNVDELKPALTALGTHARNLIVNELKLKQAEVEQINAAANEIVFSYDYGARRGLHTDERRELAGTANYLRQVESVAREGRRIAGLLGGNVQAWESILSDIGNQTIRIESILNRPG